MADTDTSTSPITTIDSSNALYLHPSDQLGMILVLNVFDGTEFGAWKRAMTIASLANNKLCFVNNTLVMPSDEQQMVLWKRCNDMVISWILNTLTRDIRDNVLYAETAKALWNELNARYGQANGAKLYLLQKNFCQITQGNNDIPTYLQR
ncbi:uncharacterized protein LOC143623673 [Bidens hawaiensis]|uniref:uncharacterized protein LOC143623673 n=1 Tax=Bidens hawaiensis TaxID=980011 RepID=UPI004049FA40